MKQLLGYLVLTGLVVATFWSFSVVFSPADRVTAVLPASDSSILTTTDRSLPTECHKAWNKLEVKPSRYQYIVTFDGKCTVYVETTTIRAVTA
jgi:hypothetical protein